MSTADDIVNQIYFIHSMTPNNQEFGDKIRQVIMQAKKEPERSCDIDDEECISCGSWNKLKSYQKLLMAN